MTGRNQYGWTDSQATCAHSYLVPSVLSALPSGRLRIADIGSGNGYLAGVLASRGHAVAGIEASEDGVAQARAAHPTIQFEQISIYDDVAAAIGRDFDVAVATEVVEHLVRPRELFRAALSILKPGGCLVITTPYHGYVKNLALAITGRMDRHFLAEWDGGHIKFFSVTTLRRMAEQAGVKRVRFTFAGRVPLLWKSMVLIGEK